MREMLGAATAAPPQSARAFWRETFARYASAEEGRLEGLCHARGRALVEQIYPERDDRLRIYRTSLPPREATTLFEVAPQLLEHLQTGSEYARWSPEQQLQYIVESVEIVGVVPKLRVPLASARAKLLGETCCAGGSVCR